MTEIVNCPIFSDGDQTTWNTHPALNLTYDPSGDIYRVKVAEFWMNRQGLAGRGECCSAMRRGLPDLFDV